jgi:uncharacterized membrane protein
MVSSMTTRKRFWLGWAIAVGVTSFLVTLSLLPPFVPADPREVLMQVFSRFCHQIPSRSPHVHGIQLAVCHRCLGIYAALPLAAFLYLGLQAWQAALWRAARWIIPLSLIPLGLDWILDVIGWWMNTPLSRILTGAIFGIAAGSYLTRAIIELLSKRSFNSSSV